MFHLADGVKRVRQLPSVPRGQGHRRWVATARINALRCQAPIANLCLALLHRRPITTLRVMRRLIASQASVAVVFELVLYRQDCDRGMVFDLDRHNIS